MSRIRKEVWVVFLVVIGVFVFSLCLAGCGDGGPDDALVEKAAKQGIRISSGNIFSPSQPIENPSIVKRHKSYQSSFQDPGDLVIKYPFTMHVMAMKEIQRNSPPVMQIVQVEFVMFKRERDDSWWYETPSGHCTKVE